MLNQSYRVFNNNEGIRSKIRQEFANDVLIGLSQSLKWLPSKYIYDEEGSRLFKEITRLPEYYLTRAEISLLRKWGDNICRQIENREFNLIELGCGDGLKAGILLEGFLRRGQGLHFYPIDISKHAIEKLIENLKEKFPKQEVSGLVSEYFEGIYWLSSQNRKRNMVLFLGSNIGNFTPIKAGVFLSSLWRALNNGDLVFIGFDLKKDIPTMIKAYNDKKGITEKFNKNLLKRINKELNGNFNPDQFDFYATYDVVEGAIQSYLISRKKQQVFIEDLKWQFDFKAQEPIHTESSYKYNIEEIEEMAVKNNFKLIKHFFDEDKYFVDSLWKVVK
jgi:L-histidine Nalpha-methyltransferase